MTLDKDEFEVEAEQMENYLDDDEDELALPSPDDDRPVWWDFDDYEYYDIDDDLE